MKLSVRFLLPETADGEYRIQAKGFSLSILRWGDENGAWEDWTAFAYVPLCDGRGAFCFVGKRAVPPGATHVYAQLVSEDFKVVDEVAAEIPSIYQTQPFAGNVLLCAMSDFHLFDKPYRIVHALQQAEGADALLLQGDLVNDGTGEQLRTFYKHLLEQTISPVFAVAGNHDFPIHIESDGMKQFTIRDLQTLLLDRSEGMGVPVNRDVSGIYTARIGFIEIIGLQCVTEGRKFKFPNGQIEWLEQFLRAPSNAAWRILLCHAPLLSHNPQRNDGAPYLNKNIQLQRLMDAYSNLVFLSGHLHVSPNDPFGCVDWNAAWNNLYISDGSVCRTKSSNWQNAIVPKEWMDGVTVRLAVTNSEIEIAYDTLKGKHIARGYYRIRKADNHG